MRSFPGLGCVVAALVVVAACSETQLVFHTAKKIARDSAGPVGGTYKIGEPYKVDGVWHYPGVDYSYRKTGVASWYGPNFHGQRTANGELFDMNKISAAHRTLPLPSMVQVINLENGRAIRVRVNDRGPFVHGRVIDLSRRAAQLLGFAAKGTAKVRVEILEEESRQLAFLYSAGFGQTQIASVDGSGSHLQPNADDKPPVKAAPLIPVTKAPLKDPGAGTAASTATEPARSRSKSVNGSTEIAAVEPESDGRVTQEPVQITRMYIQAGSFAQYNNAHRLRARLSVLGPARVLAVMFADQQMFRVRIGPISDLKTADRMLAQMIGAGYTDARLIVDQ